MAAVLVVRRGGLGDTLLLLPVLAALRRQHPGSQLHFAGVSEFGDVLQAFGAVDRAFSSEDLQLWALQGGGAAGEAARARLCGSWLVVADDVAVLAVARDVRVAVFDPRPAREDVPLARQLGDQLGLAVQLDDARLPGASWSAPPRAPIAFAPGSGSPQKCWPRSRWLDLAERVARRGHALEVVVGPTERERDDPTRWPWPADVMFLADLTCVGLARRLLSARAFVGNDSGTTHLAAALGLPTVAVFTGGEPRVFAPPGAHVRVVAGPDADAPDLGVDRVWSELSRAIRPHSA
jgi:ADP-heptose:LPS heptosyltransferase